MSDSSSSAAPSGSSSAAAPPPPIQVHVGIGGKVLSLPPFDLTAVGPGGAPPHSIGTLKEAIFDVEGVPIHLMRLIVGGAIQKDDGALVLPGTEVHLVLRLRGGCGDRFRIARQLTSGGVRVEVLRLFVNQAEFWGSGSHDEVAVTLPGGAAADGDLRDVSVASGPGVAGGDAAMLHLLSTPLDLGGAAAITVRVLPRDGAWKESSTKLPPPDVGTPLPGSVSVSTQDGPFVADGSGFGRPHPPSPEARPAFYKRIVAEFTPLEAPLSEDDLLHIDATPFLRAALARLAESIGEESREHVSFAWNARIGGKRSLGDENFFNN